MKKALLMILVVVLLGCNRPTTPPVTPAQPPTVESTPTSVPVPTVDTTKN